MTPAVIAYFLECIEWHVQHGWFPPGTVVEMTFKMKANNIRWIDVVDRHDLRGAA